MQKKDTIQDKDNERDPLISYFRTLEKEVPEADIEKRWNALMQNVNGRGGCFICRYRLGNKNIYGSSFTFHRYCYCIIGTMYD